MSFSIQGRDMRWLAPTHQIPVDIAAPLQVRHPFTDVLTHAQEQGLPQRAFPLPQVVEQAAIFHELCHYVEGLLLYAHPIELNQPRVWQFPREEEHTSELGYPCIVKQKYIFFMFEVR